MRIRSSWRKAARPVALPARHASRYHLWVDSSLVPGPFAGPPLSEADLALASAWASAQRAWNLSLHVLSDADGRPRVLSIAGADGIEPEWLVYAADGGFQTDESFESAWSPTLDDALCTIANMPAGSCLRLLSSEPAGPEALVPA